MSFKNKTAIVTGAGQGIGCEICQQLADQGAYVILNDIDPILAENSATLINKDAKGKCVPLAGDSSDLSFINKMVELAIKQTGHLDIAIANAGITLFGDFFTYPSNDFNRVLQVNLFGSFFLAQASANVMKAQPNGGSILLTSSVTAHQAHKDLAVYGMTKAGLEMLAKNLVFEVSKFKININCIAPGATITNRTAENPEYEKTWSRITPLGSPANVTDIANSALFLVSDKAKHITGQTLIVDGGWTSISPSPI